MLEATTWIKQSAFRMEIGGRTIYTDPWGIDEGSPPADIVFISHGHYDHFEPMDIHRIRKDTTRFVAPRAVADELTGNVTPMREGDTADIDGIKVTAIPAYNVLEERLGFHPRSDGGIGFLLDFGDHTRFHAGDTDHTPELEEVHPTIAFLPVGGTYTMTASEAAGLVAAMRPGLAVPMHYGFICGSERDGEVFKQECAPTLVEVLSPLRPWGEGPKA
jgi:L-ascorbate metabolism protein UlaG (beta-lactamase superfamily)